ncbi:hypothetical protein NEOLEDRAFT_190791 [Neolentinus lepideus HHB14362 ss-1]|uniref:Uncharacterized protein n=1 Tax=Neolentinus lepideus HHB14362 ss-1 TaxID=1314782 RepID=A0A165TRQ2_9AGAM|nr:hypothetical protein NEOLEDRAFT_190791 [Neolentinus lepideus HHB14362 ss-1]
MSLQSRQSRLLFSTHNCPPQGHSILMDASRFYRRNSPNTHTVRLAIVDLLSALRDPPIPYSTLPRPSSRFPYDPWVQDLGVHRSMGLQRSPRGISGSLGVRRYETSSVSGNKVRLASDHQTCFKVCISSATWITDRGTYLNTDVVYSCHIRLYQRRISRQWRTYARTKVLIAQGVQTDQTCCPPEISKPPG